MRTLAAPLCIAVRLAAAVALALLAPSALAQKPALNFSPAPLPDAGHPSATNPFLLPLTEDLGIQAAIEKARRQNRLLMVFWCCDHPDNPTWTFCRASRSLSLRAYIKWHCIAIQTQVLPPDIGDQVCKEIRERDLTFPVVILIRGRDVEQVIGAPRNPVMGYAPVVKRDCPYSIRFAGCERQFTPGPLKILHDTDFAMDRIRARDPVWLETHDLANPAPRPPPEPEPLCTVPDDIFSIVRDPRPEEHLTALDRLTMARTALKSGDLIKAASLYTWLWERSETFEPTFRSARLSAVAQDIAAVVAQLPAARERFQRIRAAQTNRTPWAAFGQMHEWFVLSAATGDQSEVLDYLDYAINDLDEGAILPRPDLSALNTLAHRENFADAWQLPPASTSPVARVRAIAGKLNPKFSSIVSITERAEYQAFARQFLIDEGARLYTATLIKGDDAAAQDIATTILQAVNTPDARSALLTTALAADPPQARPIHLEWLAAAEGAGGAKRDDLRARLAANAR